MMNPSFRLFEISLYALMNFLPFLALTIYTFYKYPRFSRPVTVSLCFLATAIQIGTRFWGAYSVSGNTLSIIVLRLFAYIILLVIAVDVHPGKIVFVELIFSNLSSLIMISASCLKTHVFPGEYHPLYCWHNVVFMVLLHLLLTLPFFQTVRKKIRPAVEEESYAREWSYYWMIPGIFNIIWQYQLYGTDLDDSVVLSDPRNMLFLLLVNFGSLLIYYLVLSLSSQMKRNLELEHANHYMDIEKLEYQLLEERITEARQARHDLRHHMILMENYIQAGEYDLLAKYLENYKASLPEPEAIHFCSHRAINVLLLHFAHQARAHKIDFRVKLNLSEEISISDIDISVLLGNLLENALDACVEQKQGERFISVRGFSSKTSLVFTIDNSCSNEIKKNKKGQFLSTKQKGMGLGIESAKHIVERYDGVFAAEKKDDGFYVSFLLNL